MMKMITVGVGWKITERIMITIRDGSDRPASTMRIMSASMNPPAKPEIAP
jgi:hypothetical protein